MPFSTRATAFAPGSIGNFGPGLDILGCAVDVGGDTVEATWCDEPGVSILDPGHATLPTEAQRHASGIAALDVLRRASALGGTTLTRGVGLRVQKGLPLSAGQGGSAASAVAGAVAVNALLGAPLTATDLLAAALAAEAVVAGRHLDNVAPSLLGGLVLVRSLEPIDVIALPVPRHLRLVLAVPAQQLRTADARAALPSNIARVDALHQAAQVGAIVAACYSGDLAQLGRAIDDRIAEPVRARLLPGFADAKRAALDAGALGVSISGAGPTSFAVCASDAIAAVVAPAMCAAYEASGLSCVAGVSRVDRLGARVQTTVARSVAGRL